MLIVLSMADKWQPQHPNRSRSATQLSMAVLCCTPVLLHHGRVGRSIAREAWILCMSRNISQISHLRCWDFCICLWFRDPVSVGHVSAYAHAYIQSVLKSLFCHSGGSGVSVWQAIKWLLEMGKDNPRVPQQIADSWLSTEWRENLGMWATPLLFHVPNRMDWQDPIIG